jgi:hypothetical protein
VVQDHYGYVPVVGLLAGMVVVVGLARWWTARRARREAGDDEGARPGRRWSWALVSAVVVGAVLWWPPFYDELSHSPGNPRQLVRFVTAHPENGRMGVSFAADRLVEFLGWKPIWTHRNPVGFALFLDPTASQVVLGTLVAVVAVGALVLALVRRRWANAQVQGIAVLVMTGLFVSTASLPVEQSSLGLYNYRAWWPATVFLLIATTLTVVDLVRPSVRWRGDRVARVAGAGFLVAGLAASAVACWTPRTDLDRSRWAWPAIAVASREVPPKLDDDGTYLVLGRGIMAYSSVASGVIQALERNGIDTMVSREQESTLGRFRRWDPDRSRGTVLVSTGETDVPPGSEVLSRWEASPALRQVYGDNPFFSPEIVVYLVPPRAELPEVDFTGSSRSRTTR